MRNIAFMPERDVLKSHDAVRAHDPSHPANALGEDRVTLMRHGARSLLAFFEFLLRFAHFGPLPVTNLQSELVQRRSDNGQGAEVLRVVVALNNLRRNGSRFDSQPGANLFLDLRIEMRKSADCSADFSDGH